MVSRWQSDFWLLVKILSDLLSMRAVQNWAVLNSNLISECLCKRKLKWKKSHLKILNVLYVIEVLTKLLDCSKDTNVFIVG